MEYDFSQLPEEIQRLYLLKLPVTDIANYCAVNPSVNKICTDDYFWLLKVDYDFHVHEYKPKDITYQQQFLDLLSITDPNEAAKQGRLDILMYLESQDKLPGEQGLINTIINGHLNVLKWLVGKTRILFPTQSIVTFASANGHINILEWLGSKGIPFYLKGANSAAENGHINVLDWLEQRGVLPDKFTIARVAKNGHVNVLDWLEARNILPSNNIGYIENTDVLDWLEQRQLLPRITYAWQTNSIATAIQHGNLSRLQWLERRGIQPTKYVANIAVEFGRIEILEWLKERNVFPDINGANNIGTYIDRFDGRNKDVIKQAIEDNIINVLNWLDNENILPDVRGANNLVNFNNSNILEWLEKRGILPDTIGANNAAKNYNIYTLKWLEKRGILPNTIGANNAAKKRNINV